MKTSDSIKEIIPALLKVQGSIGKARKDKDNPFFKSKYADLESVWGACHEQLQENKIVVVQTGSEDEGQFYLITTLIHESGEWISSDIPLVMEKETMQGLGSAITYSRRFGLSAILGILQEDDDGNKASTTKKHQNTSKASEVNKSDKTPQGHAHEVSKEHTVTFNGTMIKIKEITDSTKIATASKFVEDNKDKFKAVEYKTLLDTLDNKEKEFKAGLFDDKEIPV